MKNYKIRIHYRGGVGSIGPETFMGEIQASSLAKAKAWAKDKTNEYELARVVEVYQV